MAREDNNRNYMEPAMLQGGLGDEKLALASEEDSTATIDNTITPIAVWVYAWGLCNAALTYREGAQHPHNYISS